MKAPEENCCCQPRYLRGGGKGLLQRLQREQNTAAECPLQEERLPASRPPVQGLHQESQAQLHLRPARPRLHQRLQAG